MGMPYSKGGEPTFAAPLMNGSNGRKEIFAEKFPRRACLKSTPAAHQANEISLSLARV